MKTLRRQLTVTLLLTLLLAWIGVSAFQQYETMRAQTGVRDLWLRDAATQMLASLPVSLLGSVAPTERFAPPGAELVDGHGYSSVVVGLRVWICGVRRCGAVDVYGCCAVGLRVAAARETLSAAAFPCADVIGLAAVAHDRPRWRHRRIELAGTTKEHACRTTTLARTGFVRSRRRREHDTYDDTRK